MNTPENPGSRWLQHLGRWMAQRIEGDALFALAAATAIDHPLEFRGHPLRPAACRELSNPQGLDPVASTGFRIAGLTAVRNGGIGGIVFSTLLTLLVLPALYRWLHRDNGPVPENDGELTNG